MNVRCLQTTTVRLGDSRTRSLLVHPIDSPCTCTSTTEASPQSPGSAPTGLALGYLRIASTSAAVPSTTEASPWSPGSGSTGLALGYLGIASTSAAVCSN